MFLCYHQVAFMQSGRAVSPPAARANFLNVTLTGPWLHGGMPDGLLATAIGLWCLLAVLLAG